MFRLLVVYWFLSTKIWECNSQSVKCDFINDDKVTTPGTCIKLNDCAVVKQRFKEHNTVTEWCPNGRKKRIVCCPFPEEVKVRSHSIRTSVKSKF